MSTELPKPLMEALADGLLIAYRAKNNSLDYSIMNRPEATLSGVDDHALATAIVIAVREFEFKLDEGIMKSERVTRYDGRAVTYNEAIDIDWEDRVIRTSRRVDFTKDMLAAIVTQLVRGAAAPTSVAKQN